MEVNNKIVWENLRQLGERVHNLKHVFGVTSAETVEAVAEMHKILCDIRYNLALIEDELVSGKQDYRKRCDEASVCHI